MEVYLNRSIGEELLAKLRKVDPGYFPRLNFPFNRTVYIASQNLIFQIDSNFNICEVVVPNCTDIFLNTVFLNLVTYMTGTIRDLTSVKVANEVGFKVLLYVNAALPAASLDFWGSRVAQFDFIKSPTSELQTLFGVNLITPHVKFVMPIYLDSSYQLIKNPSLQPVSSNPATGFGNFSSFSGVQTGTSNSQVTQPPAGFTVPTNAQNSSPNGFGNFGNFSTPQVQSVFGSIGTTPNQSGFGNTTFNSNNTFSTPNPSSGFGNNSFSTPNPQSGFGNFGQAPSQSGFGNFGGTSSYTASNEPTTLTQPFAQFSFGGTK